MSAAPATSPQLPGDHARYVDSDYLAEAALELSLPEPERVLFAGDMHGRLDQLQFLAGLATREGAEVILQAGDLGYWPHTDRNWVRKADRILTRAGVHLIAIDGNHENFSALAEPRPSYGAWKLLGRRMLWAERGSSWSWRGKTILALGGAPSIDIAWRRRSELARSKSHQRSRWLWWPEEEITDADVERAIAAGDADILLCHDAPASVRLPFALTETDACKASRQRVQRVLESARPELVVHGHYHVRYSGVCGGFDWAARVEGLGREEMGAASAMLVDLSAPLPEPPYGSAQLEQAPSARDV